MNCAVCGKDNQPGTRFCVHCGAALGPPRGATAAGAAPAARPAVTPPPATPVAAGALGEPAGRTAPPVPPPPTNAPVASVSAEIPPSGGAPAVPAYAAQPAGGAGKILMAIGIAALIVAAAGIGYKIFGGSAEVKDSLAGFTVTSPPAAPTASRAVETPPPATGREPVKIDEPALAPKAEPPAPKAESDNSRAADDDGKPKPATAPLASEITAPGPKADAKAAKSGLATPREPAAAPGTGAPAASRPPAPASTPAAVPVQDRWAQMAEEQRICRQEVLFKRVICDQRVRLRYCNGYWGTVPQCPGAVANPDKGQ